MSARQAIIPPEVRREVIAATKAAMAEVPKGSRNDPMLKTTVLSTLVMARYLGYSRDEAMACFREEWVHMTELDNTTVRKEEKR